MNSLKLYEELSIDELDRLIDELKSLRREKFNAKYTVVDVANFSGNISMKIQQETGFGCQHSGKSGYIGINHIIIPKENYNIELEKELIAKYQNV